MKRVYIGNKELTTIATRDSAGGGGGDDTQKWVDYFNGTLTEFTVPEGVTKIKKYAFQKYAALTSVTISNSVTSIGEWAFEGCSGLTSVTIPDSVTSIGGTAFANCTGLTSVILPDSLTKIDISTFNYCLNLTGITIPDKVTFIGYGAFGGCAKLKTMTVNATTPPTLGNDAIPSNVTTIYVPSASVDTYKSADGWSKYADKIQAIAQSETVVTYNDGTSKEFAITGELTDSSIDNKDNATNVYIGTSVTSIGYRAFKQCFQLTAITLSDSVTYIDYEAFSYSYRFASITIPNSVTGFSTYAFAGCSGLESVTIENSANKLTYTNSLFSGISSNAKLYAPSNLLSDYKADSNWTSAFKGGIFAIQ